MQESPSRPPSRPVIPPPQKSYEEAASRALAVVRRQQAEQLVWLGASGAADRWTVPVLDDTLTVELEGGVVRDSSGGAVGPWWRVLLLHYLSVPGRPVNQPPAITFADLPGGRAYASVYQQRVIERLCRTVGGDSEALHRAAEARSGQVVRDSPDGAAAPGGVEGGHQMFEFCVFPRVRVRLAWYEGDQELSPSAALLLPGNIESFFCLEDIVVMSERLISRLAGGRF